MKNLRQISLFLALLLLLLHAFSLYGFAQEVRTGECQGTVQQDTKTPAVSPSQEVSPGGSAEENQPTPSPEPSEPEDKIEKTPEPGTPPEKKEETKPAEEEKPVIVTNISVEGNETIPTEEILKVISTRIGEPLLEPKIRADMHAVFEMGYFTDVKADTQYFVGGVKIVFKVLENPVVKEIQFEGNTLVGREKLLSLMETKEGKILNTRALYSDVGEINKYYDEELGYLLRPTHITDLRWTEEEKLILTITEGMMTREVRIEGSTIFSEDELKKLVKSKPGDLFNQKILREDSSEIAKFYEKKDYILDTIRPNIDPVKGEVTIKVLEAVVEDIKIEGNKRTKDFVIKRNLRTRVGEVLRKRKVQRDIERLNNLGYFEKVEITPEAGSEPGKVVLLLKVKEQKTGLATLGVGYTGGGSGAVRPGLTGAVSLSERNLGGRGLAVAAQWQKGVNIDNLAVSYYDPAIDAQQNSFGISAFSHRLVALRQPVPGTVPLDYALYDDNRTGGSVTLGHPLSDDLRVFLTLKHESIELVQSERSIYVPIGMFKGTTNSLAGAALYDTRDDVFNPLSGAFINGSLQYAGGFLRGSTRFDKYQIEGRRYFPVWKNKTIALRVWGGYLKGNAPVTDYFFVGGTDTLRGYQENSFFGNRMLVFNAEFRFPIAKIKMLSGAIFGDAGNAWFPGDRSKLYKNVGAGIRLVFPSLGLGVIRIDYAVGEKGGRSTIGIGQTF